MKMTTRQEMELDVRAHNHHLRGRVKTMSNITLLRNTHPLYREEFAKRLHKEGKLTDKELKEFTIN
jgi:hypothetical protein